jgi:hypothetical protein
MFKRNKKGALEMSVGTIVVIVLAMSMLILGLVLVRNIFSGATEGVDLVNQNVKNELKKLFNDDTTSSVVYLPGNQADVKKKKTYNIEFGITNNLRGESGSSDFTYTVSATEVESGCELTLTEANSFIILGRSGGPLSISSGSEPVERIIQVRVPDDAPLCSITYDLRVESGGEHYDTNFFILEIN